MTSDTRQGQLRLTKDREHHRKAVGRVSASRRGDPRRRRGVVRLEHAPRRMFVAKVRDASQGVEITVVYATHANNVPLSLLSEAPRKSVASDDAGIALDLQRATC